MKIFNLNNMTKGWFAGNFEPSAYKTDCEVAIKRYKAGDYESLHHHKLSTEVTVIVSGIVEMNGRKFQDNDIILVEQNESTDFKCLTDVITCVFKSFSCINDKYFD